MGEWCNSLDIVAKPNGTVLVCPDSARFNQALIRPIHRWPALNIILLKLTNAYYFIILDANSGYHDLKLCKKSSYLTILHVIWKVQIQQTTISRDTSR